MEMLQQEIMTRAAGYLLTPTAVIASALSLLALASGTAARVALFYEEVLDGHHDRRRDRSRAAALALQARHADPAAAPRHSTL